MGDRRLRYWDEGASALQSLGWPREYVCPLCLRLFPRECIGDLSLDHVPPKSVGGKLEVLACRTCNSTAGHVLDVHAANAECAGSIMAGQPHPPVRARFTFDGIITDVELRTDRALHHDINLLAQCNAPGVLEKVRAVFEAHAAAGTAPSIDFVARSLTYHELRARTSYLRAGYLAAFAAFGYSAVTLPSLDAVRRQIKEPDAEHLAYFFYRDKQLDEYEVALIEEPAWHRCIMVMMGRFRITLPLDGGAGVYERIAEAAAVGNPVRLHGRRLGWPARPLYAADRAIAARRRAASRLAPQDGRGR